MGDGDGGNFEVVAADGNNDGDGGDENGAMLSLLRLSLRSASHSDDGDDEHHGGDGDDAQLLGLKNQQFGEARAHELKGGGTGRLS